MATLDYVIMSEFARIDPSGLVTIVGGSFDRVQAQERGVGQRLFVTLRALLEEAETSISFEVKVRPPTAQFEIGVRGQAARRPVASPRRTCDSVSTNTCNGCSLQGRTSTRAMWVAGCSRFGSRPTRTPTLRGSS